MHGKKNRRVKKKAQGIKNMLHSQMDVSYRRFSIRGEDIFHGHTHTHTNRKERREKKDII